MKPGYAAFLLVTFAVGAAGSTIVVVSNVPSASHSLWYNKMVALLASNGHEVIFLDTEPEKKKVQNVTHIHMEGGTIWREEMDSSFLDTLTRNLSPKDNMDHVYDLEKILCRALITSEGVKNFLKDYKGKKVDLILFDYFCDCFFGLVKYYGDPPFIVATAYSDPDKVLRMVGLYDNPAYVPVQLSSNTDRMTFRQRAVNLFYSTYQRMVQELYLFPFHDELLNEIFGPGFPPVADIGKNVSLVMVNTHFAFNGAKPGLPAVIPIAGFHIDPPKALPKVFDEFLNGAKEGAIFMSFGSNIPSAAMPAEKKKMFMDAFRNLPYKVLWKLEDERLEGIPPNVLTTKWLPQGDILAHPNVKCFISHGGLLGTQEAMDRGVPVIGIPFMLDQQEVLHNLEQKGVGIRLDYNKLTENVIRESIVEIFNNHSYIKKMKELSIVFRDLPDRPQERVMFWIEYVLRHGRHENYLKTSALDLTWYQLTMLDVILLAGFTIYLTLSLLTTFIKEALESIFSKKIKTS